MTIEERNTARAIQAIARNLKEPTRIDWEQRKWELAKEIYAGVVNHPDGNVRECINSDLKMAVRESIHYAEVFIEEYKSKQ